MFLLLDNFEQVVTAGVQLVDLLAAVAPFKEMRHQYGMIVSLYALAQVVAAGGDGARSQHTRGRFQGKVSGPSHKQITTRRCPETCSKRARQGHATGATLKGMEEPQTERQETRTTMTRQEV